jgi:hypothetical protein
MALFITLGLLVIALTGWLIFMERRSGGGIPRHDASAAARRSRGDADRIGGGGDGMNFRHVLPARNRFTGSRHVRMTAAHGPRGNPQRSGRL